MLNLKTREEMYNDYLTGIRQLENEVTDLENGIEDKQIQINHKKYRIEKLKETANMYKSNQNITINISSPIINSIEETEYLRKAIKAELDKHTTFLRLN